jgi:hypothetical protein
VGFGRAALGFCRRGRDGPSAAARPPASQTRPWRAQQPGPKSTGMMGTLRGFPNPPAKELVGQSPPSSTR